MRASLETGGVPLRAALPAEAPAAAGDLRPLRRLDLGHARPASSSSRVLHALHDSFRKLRSFVFIERISEVTDVFEHERDFRKIVDQTISSEGGVADISGYTDYGRVWLEVLDARSPTTSDPRSTVIVLGDARTNGREPHADTFWPDRRARRPHLLAQPEPKLYWNYGDSVMAAYEPLLRRRLRVLDDQTPGELRQRDRRRRPGGRLTLSPEPRARRSAPDRRPRPLPLVDRGAGGAARPPAQQRVVGLAHPGVEAQAQLGQRLGARLGSSARFWPSAGSSTRS